MLIKGEQFVAKKLVDMGNGRGPVPLPEAVRLLSADLVRMKWMEYFAKAFFARGEWEGTELSCEFVHSHCSSEWEPLTMFSSLPSLGWVSHQALHR